MMRTRASTAAISAGMTFVLCAVASFVAPSAAAARPPYVFLEGSHAASFQLPSDEQLVNSWTLFGSDVTVTRYQQVVSGAAVADGQLSVVKRGATTVLVIGRHSGSVTFAARPTITAQQAASIGASATAVAAVRASSDVSGAPNANGLAARQVDLRVDPDSGRPFYMVESYAPGTRVFHEI